MIELSLEDLSVAALVLSVVAVATFAWVSRSSNAKLERRSLRRRRTCRLCLTVFEEERRGEVEPCPACGAGVEPGRPRQLG